MSSSVLSSFFISIAALALLLAWWKLWKAIRTLAVPPLSDVPDATPIQLSSDRARKALELEKDRLLLSIKDIEYEHALGKLSDADFEELNTNYRNRAKRLIQSLDDDQKPWLEKAEEFIRKQKS